MSEETTTSPRPTEVSEVGKSHSFVGVMAPCHMTLHFIFQFTTPSQGESPLSSLHQESYLAGSEVSN
jgi:hypothetical protein